MHAISVTVPGDASALAWTELPVPVPGAGEALVRIEAAGVNYIDVYHRSGFYPLPCPFTPGSEGAGVVVQPGPGVSTLAVGDRVAFASHPGAYAQYAVVPAAKLVVLPAALSARSAAAIMLQGMTAHYLCASTFAVEPGMTALVHAGAGGVGGLLIQMIKQRGGRVLATASTSKLETVRELGADLAIDYSVADFRDEVMRATAGAGVDVVYDAVGRTTFDQSLDSLKLRGMLVSYGQASGPVPPFDPLRLSRKGTYLTRPSLGHYTSTRAELEWRAREVFDAVVSGALRLRVERELPLERAAEAHRLLESRRTAGKLLLLP